MGITGVRRLFFAVQINTETLNEKAYLLKAFSEIGGLPAKRLGIYTDSPYFA